MFEMNCDSHSSVLVTGGAGFLGSHICERMLSEGRRVVCLDNLLTGSRANVRHLIGSSNFSFVEGDVRADLPDGPFEEIWNLASPASPPQYQRDPIGTMLTNVLGMNTVLSLAVKCGAKVFQASTSEVYGDPLVHPQSEDYRGSVNTVGPRACYDEGKRAAEALCYDYVRMHGLDIRVARIFNTYGPRMAVEDGRVVSNFIVKALADKPLEIYGDGSQTRSFCYRDDLVEGFFRLMRAAPQPNGPINLGNPDEFTVLELANLIIGMTGSRSAILLRPLPQDDPRQRRPDIARAKSLLNWEPRIDLRQGLRLTIEHYRNLVARHAASVA